MSPHLLLTLASAAIAIAGLVFSLAGDVVLMWPKEGFLPGLVAFLVAHLCYLLAFTRGTRLAAIGGALFVASDALLATHKFMAPLPAGSLWILATYWTAQWLIASSLPPRRAGSTSP